MSTERDVTRIVRSWLEEGATALPDRVLDNVLDRLPATHQRRPWWSVRKAGEMQNPIRIGLAAAAILIVALIGLNVMPKQAVVGPSPTASPSAQPTINASASPISLNALRSLNLALPPGAYQIGDPFSVPFTFTVGRDWQVRSFGENDATLSKIDATRPDVSPAWLKVNPIDGVYADPCHTVGGPTRLPSPPSVDAAVTALTHMTGFDAGGVTDVVVGGHAGKHFVLSNEIDAIDCTFSGLLPLWTWPGSPPAGAGTNGGSVDEIWVIDVNGTTVAIDGEAEDAFLPTGYPQELEAIVSTIQFQH